ncbi:ABC transporter permease subunit [Ktedonobacter robiniae]|uniref:ABC transporter permease n=1 Tax=Ktedonobacter robiniae TaxID=2778365 RepID=A0ABQ3V5T8_9CHLR|nr:ABC transporter permease subunit [Ktedonobacter robiniae]GHO60581.1 hypothetical protein KSB_90560 [Ktedonobacter robiniae]
MIKSFIAEMDKGIRRPATWVLVVAWALAAIAFVYVNPYIKYVTPASNVSATDRQALLTGMLPANLISEVIAGFPIFGGTIALIFGALMMGSEYGWGTFKTLLMQRSNRLSMLSGKLFALAVMQLAFVLVVFGSGAVSSFIVATLTHSSVRWPSAEDFMQGIGAAWVIMIMWALLGAMLATLLRGSTLAVGLGLFYLLLELFFRNTAGTSGPLAELARVLPGSNAGVLAAPGVAAAIGVPQSVLVLIAYSMGFVLLSLLLFLRRDVV